MGISSFANPELFWTTNGYFKFQRAENLEFFDNGYFNFQRVTNLELLTTNGYFKFQRLAKS